jgi:hypothetical protein
MSWTIILAVLLGLIGVVAAALVYGAARWRSATKAMRARLEAARRPIRPAKFNSKELTGLPVPVQRYFRTVLADGQSMIAAVSVEHAGSFNMSETGEQWKPFTSNQRVVTQRPGFVWDARIAMMPGMRARVHDAYVAGEGILHATLFGLVSLVDCRGTPEVARGELMRFFAEAAWYPTALLPGQGVQWEAVDDTSARATMTDGEIALKMLFRFDKDGLIESMRAEARERTVAGSAVATPWEGRFNRYEVRNGMRVPLEGEVAWVLPEGRKPYWRGRITRLEYQFAR